MARTLRVDIVGDSSSLQRGFSNSAAAAGQFEGKIKGVSSRVTSSFAMMGAGLLAGGGVIAGMKQAVTQAEAYGAQLKSLQVAVEHTGGSWDSYKGQMAQVADAGVKFGYTNQEVLGGLKLMTLLTGNATDALKYIGLAEDLARARGISLTAATAAVSKAIDGKTTALQRYGVVAAKGESVEQLLTHASAVFAGQAASNTTTTQKLTATLSNLETKIGTVLLPTVNRIATAIENWIGKSKNQKRVMDDVRQAVADATAVIKKMWGVVNDVQRAFGGWKNVLLGLVAIKVASWAASVISSIIAIGSAAAGAAGSVSGLGGALLSLRGLAAVGLAAAGAYSIYKGVQGARNANPDYKGSNGVGLYNAKTGVTTYPTRASSTSSPIEMRGAQAAAQHYAATVVVHHAAIAPRLPVSYGGGGGGGGGGAKHGPAYKIPQALEAKIRAAQQKFTDGATESHLDILDRLYKQEETLLKAHGQDAKAQSVANEIAKAGATFQKVLAAAHLKIAQAMIAKITAGSTGPEQMLKLDQAAGLPVAAILADQNNLMGAYQAEAATLKTKLASSTGKAKAAYQSALTKIQGSITSTQDSIVQSLQSIAQAAQTHLQGIISSIETAADQALGAQYSQGGIQTPTEALLAQMQSEDTKKTLQDALTTALTAGDPAAIEAAQRAITENDLAVKATKERAAADAAYAVAQWNLNSQIELLSANVGDGAGAQDALNKLLGQFGISLNGLSDPGGGGLLTQLQSAVAATTLAFTNLNSYMTNPSGGPNQGGGGGSVTLPGGISVPAGVIGHGFGGSFASGGTVPGALGAPSLILAHGGERVIPVGGAGGGVVFAPTINLPNYLGDKREAARQIANEIATLLRANGAPGLAAAIRAT